MKFLGVSFLNFLLSKIRPDCNPGLFKHPTPIEFQCGPRLPKPAVHIATLLGHECASNPGQLTPAVFTSQGYARTFSFARALCLRINNGLKNFPDTLYGMHFCHIYSLLSYCPSNRQIPTRIHGVSSQNEVLFPNTLVIMVLNNIHATF